MMAVSILDFKGEDVRPKVLKACFQRLETSLIESNRFTVIEKNEREEILNEQKVQSSGICDTDCIVELGKLLAADYLMLGEIIGFSGLYQIDIKIINVEKGDIIEKVTEEVEGKVKDLLKAMESASKEIILRLSTQTPSIVQTPLNIKQETAVQKFGFINIITEPAGAIVLVDNQKIGTTPIEGKKVRAGKSGLKIIKSGYNTINKGIRVVKGDTVSLNELLTFKKGSLELSSNPPGASIYIGNAFRGITPLKLSDLTVGRYEIRASLLDYFDASENVIVEYDNTTNLIINLAPRPGSLNFVLNISDVEIYINKKKYRSDQSGFTTINNITPGNYDIRLVKAGYESVYRKLQVPPNKSETIEVEMYLEKNYESLELEELSRPYLVNKKQPYFIGERKKFPSKLSTWIHFQSGIQFMDSSFVVKSNKAKIKELPDVASLTIGSVKQDKKFKIISSYNGYIEIDIPKNELYSWSPSGPVKKNFLSKNDNFNDYKEAFVFYGIFFIIALIMFTN